jgi:HK97 gp10 family phage protein
MPMSMKLDGIDELRGRLKFLAQVVNEDATRGGVQAAAVIIRDAMILDAPVLDETTAHSTALPPDTLKTGIGYSLRKMKNGVFVALIGPRKGTRRAAHNVEYGHMLVKDGTHHVGPAGVSGEGKVIGHVSAKPFLRPAFEHSRKLALQAFANVLRLRLKEAGR